MLRRRALLFSAVLALILAGVYLRVRKPAPNDVPVAGDTPVAVAPAPLPIHVLTATQSDEKAVATLIEILASKNDNDPRLDRDFNALSVKDKLAFQQHYRQLAPEKRNERGTIVFLLGRNLTAAADFAFLIEVLTEPACLSLADCARDERSNGGDDHYASDRELTLAYPQVVAIKSVEKALEQTGNPELTNAALAALHTAQNSRIPTVARMAGKVREH